MLIVRDLHKSYPSRQRDGTAPALSGVSITVAQGDFFTLLGPSGCGKTTTLQCIAGLETPNSGRIEIGGDAVYCSDRRVNQPANRRDLGMVFQSYAIWPHMSVSENVAFPLVHGVARPPSDVTGRVKRALERVQLTHLADRPAPLLSGGQQQRVALARALVHEPRLLLLDEPLSNLDAKLRDAMRVELRRLVKSLGITTVLVTHDQIEAMGMSDQVALMRDGRIVQTGAPRDIYLRPTSAFAADFMGRSNILAGKVVATGECIAVETPIGLVHGEAAGSLSLNAPVSVIARPQAIVLQRPGEATAGPNCFSGRVASVQFLGDVVEVEVAVGAASLKLLLDPYSSLDTGSEVIVRIPPERCIVIASKDEVAPGGTPS